MSNDSSYKISQEYVVQQPKSVKAYPIDCNEWDFLKNKIGALSYKRNWHMALGAALIGVALTTFVAIVIAVAIPSAPKSQTLFISIVIACAVLAISVIAAVLCIHFAFQKEEVKKSHASEIVDHMEIIETRYQ